jgi:cytochrome P450
MTDIRQAAAQAALLYRDRALAGYHGYARRHPLARLGLAPGRRDPYALYEQIRARGPLVPGPVAGTWCSTSHRVCAAVLKDRRFGVRLAEQEQPRGRMRLSFLSQNPPDHTRLRRLAQPAFSPRAMAGYVPRIEATVGGLLDAAAAAGEFDLVSAFAAALPIAVITDLLGIPDVHAHDFARIGTVIGSALGGVRSPRHAAQLQAGRTELIAMFRDLFELRRREPGDDVVSAIVAAEGTQIQPAEMYGTCVLLLVAGFETTVNAIGNGVLAMLSDPDQWQALCADPAGLAPLAAAEALRYDPPVQRTQRIALETVEVEGTTLHRGDTVATLIGGANRDPEAYARPDRFDLHRFDPRGDSPAEHLAFSAGIHYCLGKPLAVLELTIALRALAERMPGLARAGRITRRTSTVIRGPIRFPVTAGSARRAAPARVPAGRP